LELEERPTKKTKKNPIRKRVKWSEESLNQSKANQQ